MATPRAPEQASLPKRVHIYSEDELSDLDLVELSEDKLEKSPFDWQVEAAENLLRGEDTILDVGTGNGKSLTFLLPLLPNETDIVIVVSPLTALMMEQAESSKLSTVAVCAETIEAHGRTSLYKSIASGTFRQILVSPEIITSPEFNRGVLQQPAFTCRLRAVCIDEAHCISLWGGSFRKDYAALGVLRGRLAGHVPLLVASATLPTHILDDIRSKLSLKASAHTVALTNDRPNVALSVQTLKHSEESKGDMRILIPEDAIYPSDVPVAAIYCNQRLTCETAADAARKWACEAGPLLSAPEEWIVFYHSAIGSTRKREIEEGIQSGKIRLVFCTDALGMGCDFRNIKRVILWGLPPSFCALAQRAGRAARDMEMDGEAILYVTAAAVKKGIAASTVAENVEEASHELEDETGLETENGDGVQLGHGQELVSADDVGARTTTEILNEEDVSLDAAPARRSGGRTPEQFNSREARYLSMYITGERCRRAVWNEFFGNQRKRPLEYMRTSLFKPRPGLRCCDVCQPELFLQPKIILEKVPGLTRGRKRVLPEALTKKIIESLTKWRDEKLPQLYYTDAGSSTVSIPNSALLPDDVITRIALSGVVIRTSEQLFKTVRWYLGFKADGTITPLGTALLNHLAEVYDEYDEAQTAPAPPPGPAMAEIPEQRFYAQTTRGRGRGRGQGKGKRKREDTPSPSPPSSWRSSVPPQPQPPTPPNVRRSARLKKG
ncbi:hypothetical protein D9611_012205 [Ephemerocybe angulata]|uniref:DNA 3'-5' helicase n=1 Tax=Ephemerocybe angulata TaxID=980116 RepID=A0A8H5C5T0_9AGAR|nr:hypothetical protein D9611_012205 [Tulosesus angulatus]